jgi:protein TonB
MIALSATLHGAAWAAVARVRPTTRHERIEIEVVQHVRAPVAPPPAPPPPPPQRRVAGQTAAPVPAPVAAPVRAPPPALASAPDAPPPPGAPRALPKVGVSLGSTVASGGFAVGVGNTVYGKAEETAADPSSVQRTSRVVPAARLSAPPRPLDLPRIGYPADARKEGIEGQVALVLRIDPRGAVVAVRVVDAPSPSLGAAAAEGARRFRFSPALVEDEPVETEIRFTYTFLLE